jgi:hypothetical protein
MERCWSHKPGLYLVNEEQAVNCFLYDSSPEMESPDVAKVFQKN